MATPSDTAEARALIGTVVAGRYALESLLGAGGMGVVYRARQITMNRYVAVKLLHASYSNNRNAVGRFQREMQATARIEHPNTIRLYDYGLVSADGAVGEGVSESSAAGGQLFLAMELLPGRTLARVLIDEQPLPLERQLKIAIQIGKALIAAHAEGVVHRDLKPDNVMLLDLYGERDFVKVLDFGIARFVAANEDQQLTAEGAVIGTPAYMSPEQVHGGAPDLRTDLYALGIMLFEMATGAVPFAAPTTLSLLVKHVQEPPPRPSEVAPGRVPPELEELILQCLAKDPADRPANAEEVVRRLQACVPLVGAGRTATTTHDGPGRSATHPKRTALWVVAGLVVAASVAVAAWLATKGPPESSRSPGTSALVVSAGTSEPLRAAAAREIEPDVTVAIAGNVPDDSPEVPEPIPAQVDPRAPLAAIFVAAGEPDVPESCKTRGPAGKLEVLARAGRLLAGGCDAEALELLTRYQDLLADTAEGPLLLARATLRAVQTPKSALAPALAAVKFCDSAIALATLGDVYRALEERTKAKEAYLGARARAPDFFEPLAKAVHIELDEGKPGPAAFALDDYVHVHPAVAEARRLRGSFRMLSGETAAAAVDFEAASAAMPNDAEVLMWLGDARAALGELEAAQRAYCKAKALGHAPAAARCP